MDLLSRSFKKAPAVTNEEPSQATTLSGQQWAKLGTGQVKEQAQGAAVESSSRSQKRKCQRLEGLGPLSLDPRILFTIFTCSGAMFVGQIFQSSPNAHARSSDITEPSATYDETNGSDMSF